MDSNNNEIEREKLKMTISFGIIAINFGLLKLITDFANKSVFSHNLLNFLEAIIFLTTLSFVSFLLLLAAKYKNNDPDYIYFIRFGERVRNVFYDAGVDGFGIALAHGIGIFLGQFIISKKIIEDSSMAYFFGLLIFFALYFVFFTLPRLISFIIGRKKPVKLK